MGNRASLQTKGNWHSKFYLDSLRTGTQGVTLETSNDGLNARLGTPPQSVTHMIFNLHGLNNKVGL